MYAYAHFHKMNMPAEVSQIEKRLKGAGHSVAIMLRRAEVDASQWVRWKQGGQIPLMSTWSKIVEAADALEPGERPPDGSASTDPITGQPTAIVEAG